MTTIQLLTSDQHLIAVQKVKLASGDVNSVLLNVAFDSPWDDFNARTAVFYTSKDSTKYEMLLTDNECTVPHEVLANEGTLFIGIRAATTDGTKIKTSSIVQLKIVQGVNAAETTISPTMDLYQQYLAAMRNQLDPALTELNTKLDNFIAEYGSKYVKPCNVGNVLNKISIERDELSSDNSFKMTKEWSATDDCWVSLFLSGSSDAVASLYINEVQLMVLTADETSSTSNKSDMCSPIFVKKNSTLSVVAQTSSSTQENYHAELIAYGCM